MEDKDIEKISRALKQTITEKCIRVIISKPLQSGEISKVTVRPVLLQEKLYFQETRYRGTQVLHENLTANEIKEKIEEYFKQGLFGQLEAECEDKRIQILQNKKGTVTVKIKQLHIASSKGGNGKEADNTSKKYSQPPETGNYAVSGKLGNVSPQNVRPDLIHNRQRNYILPDGEPVDFLIALGVKTPDGRVVKAKYDKFRQINRYLEFVRDILPPLLQQHNGQNQEPIRIVDFGCGKSYLTFALYYYLKIMQKQPVEIIGLDLKKDVIKKCNDLKNRLGYDGLTFLCGDIKDYNGCDTVDMVVTLHACDTATDYAMEKAVKWKASVIMTVPCCQHELNRQMKADKVPELKPVLKYGLIKERMAALLTDAYRANCLEKAGYDVQILEFIDMEHTPKNILIRAVKSKKMKAASTDVLSSLDEFWKIEPTLEKLLFSENEE